MSSNPLKLSLIIPLYNEEATIKKVLTTLLRLSLPQVQLEIIVVDDGSTDNSLKKIREIKSKKIKVVKHTVNTGKGAAIISGVKKASGEYILIQDADLEYNPKYIKNLLKPILASESDVVFGTRLKRPPNFSRDEKTVRFFIHYLGNRFLSLITSTLYGHWITDMETGYKLFPKEVALSMDLQSLGFEFEAEVTAKLLKKGYDIVEIPISTNPRGYKEGKKLQTFADGTKALFTIIKYRFYG